MKNLSLYLGATILLFCGFFLYRLFHAMLFWVWYFFPLIIAIALGIALLRYGLKRKRRKPKRNYENDWWI